MLLLKENTVEVSFAEQQSVQASRREDVLKADDVTDSPLLEQLCVLQIVSFADDNPRVDFVQCQIVIRSCTGK